jgi:integrase
VGGRLRRSARRAPAQNICPEERCRDAGDHARHEVSQGLHAPEGLERSTIEQRKQHLRLHIAPYLGREKLATLTTPRLNAFLDQLRDGRRSIAMRRHVLTSVRTALAFAKGRGLVAQNVASGIRVKSDDRHAATGPLKAGRDFPSKAELKLLIDRATDRWRPFIVAAIFTGMRASELRGLRWRDVDLDAGTTTSHSGLIRGARWAALRAPPVGGIYRSSLWQLMRLGNGGSLAPRASWFSRIGAAT